jgi:hypothetical protein
MRTALRRTLFFLPLLVVLLTPTRSEGQGCILARQCAPIFGGRNPYMTPHDFLFSASLRWLDATRHFSGSAEQFQRAAAGNNVVNRQRILDLGGTYQANLQESVSISIPVLLRGSWSVPLPVNPPGQRYSLHGDGLGDVVITLRRWVHDVEKYKNENYSLGLGVKFPTGDPHQTSLFPDITGQNLIQRPVDQSIQPGDGGFGVVFDLQGFKQMGKLTLFASATYLANPKNVNGTPSILSDLFNGVLSPSDEYRRYNSVPDQYLVRVGGAVPLPMLKGMVLSVAGRFEGVPVHDLIGGSDGFRRPGHALFIEPGLVYGRGRDTFSFSAPVAIERRRDPDSHGVKGDATFADYFFLVGYTHKFGK